MSKDRELPREKAQPQRTRELLEGYQLQGPVPQKPKPPKGGSSIQRPKSPPGK
jgi:hypothetical protein